MTLILTFALPETIVQLSDRLITKVRSSGSTEYRVHDPASNKLIVYIGHGCKMLLAYTGTAYVNSEPTDLWIADLLWGTRIQRYSGFTFRSPPQRLLNAREVVELLADRLPLGIEVAIGAWQRSTRGDVPRLWTVKVGTISPVEVAEGTDRGIPVTQGYEVPVWGRDDDRNELLTTLKLVGSDWKESRGALVHYMQQVATYSDAVGGDIMVTSIDKNDRFVGTSFHLEDGGPLQPGMTYAPAAIFPGVAIPPARMHDHGIALTVGIGYTAYKPEHLQEPSEWIYAQNVNRHAGDLITWFDHDRPHPPKRW